MWPKPFKRLPLLAAAALALAGACSSFTGAAGESPFALEQVDGATYLLSHEKQVTDGSGEKDRWRLQRIGPRAGDPVLFAATYSLDRPQAVAGIAAPDGEIAAWVVARYPGRLLRVERLGLDGSRAAWSMTSTENIPDAYRVLVTGPADASFTWLYFGEAQSTQGIGLYRPLLQIDADGLRVVADDVVWARCDDSCRYLVDEDGTLSLKNVNGETLVQWSGERSAGLRAVCGSELVTESRRYAVGATAVVARPLPRKFLADATFPGRLACRDDLADWLWMASEGAFAVDVTQGTTRKLFGWPEGIRNPLAVLNGDGRAVVAFDEFRDGTQARSTETLTCDNDRPLSEPCAADYVFFKTSVSATTLRR